MSIRCELEIGNDEDYLKNAKQRAIDIISILFDKKINTFFYYYYYISDYDYEDKLTNAEISSIKRCENNNLMFDLNMLHKYEHEVIRNVKINRDDYDDMLLYVNRIICHSKETIDFERMLLSNYEKVISTIHFVSKENECIMSIYDDRGCDIVFFDESKNILFHKRLEMYFLDYDKEKMY